MRANLFSFYANQRKIKTIKKLNIKYQDIEIKQHSQVTYLGCVMDETMSREPMALKVINRINRKLKFLYQKNSFLTPGLRRMLCNTLIQPHLVMHVLRGTLILMHSLKSQFLNMSIKHVLIT